jgi:hypothetical protein
MTFKQEIQFLKSRNRKLKRLLKEEIVGNTFSGYWAGKDKETISKENNQKWKEFQKENKI